MQAYIKQYIMRKQASKQGYNLDVGHHKNITISQLNHLSESKYCLGIWKCGKWKWK